MPALLRRPSLLKGDGRLYFCAAIADQAAMQDELPDDGAHELGLSDAAFERMAEAAERAAEPMVKEARRNTLARVVGNALIAGHSRERAIEVARITYEIAYGADLGIT